jgi:hypothetical protein
MSVPSRAVLVASLLAASSSFGWGFDGHRRLASVMQDAMPAGHCLRAWFTSRQTSTLQDKACDPDRWRGTDAAEAPRHFLEIDWVSPIASYPRDWAAAQAALGRFAYNNGVVPWRVEEQYASLVDAFRAKDTTLILDTAFRMSHYVFDSFSVLHDTKNFDPNGLHQRWESDMLGVSTYINGITTLAVSYYGTAGKADPRYNIFDVVTVGNPLAAMLVSLDNPDGGTNAQLYNATKDLTARRWGDGVTVMSSLLWSAWAEAGRPELTGFTTGCARTAPVAEIVLKGYPVPGGFTHPVDAGLPDAGPPDAGLEDGGGSSAGGGSGSGGFGGSGFPPVGGGGGGTEAPGCSCGSVDVALALAGLVLLARRRR